MSRLKIDVPKELKKEVGLDKLNDKDLMSKLHFRGVDVKRDNRLNEAIECYVRKIPLLIEQNKINKDPLIEEKIARLKEKLGCCIKELELRDAQKVDRTAILHDTIYYIDLTNGNDANDGLSADNDHSWKTIGKYTTTTVRTAGDIAYVRANTTQTLGAIINFDEDGTFNSPISIIGCDAVTNDPWGDASNIKPIINGNGGAYYLYIYGDNFWVLERLDLRNTTSSTNGILSINGSMGIKITSCDVSGCSARGTYITGISGVIFNNCTFSSNGTTNVYYNSSNTGEFYNCTFNAGTGCSYGLDTNGILYLYNCSFGQSSAHGTTDIVCRAIIYGQNCILNSGTALMSTGAHAFFEDWQQNKGTHYSLSYWNIISDDSDIQIDSLDSVKLAPTTNSNALHWGTHQYGTYKLWLASGSYTISVKARETAAWAVDPNSSAFFFRASYLNHATNATRTFVDSAQALSGTSEITFTMAVAPAQDGFVYVTPYLLAYASGKSINYSIKPSVT